jgi:RHS repeat-associated protein
MRRFAHNRSVKNRSARPVTFSRPMVELLEDRLPPGDMLLGGALAVGSLAPGMALPTAASVQAIRIQPEASSSPQRFAQPSQVLVAVGAGLTSTHFFAANTSPGQQRAMNRSSNPLQPVYRELSGLDEDVLDQLLADDGDPQSSQPRQRHASLGANDGHSPGLDPATARGPGAGGAPSSALGQGTQDAGTPDLANEMNGGLVGGGGGASPQAGTNSTSSVANTLTEAAFAQGAAANAVSTANGSVTSSTVSSVGAHGRITPFTSSVVWPSDTPPSSGSSGGGPSIDTVNSSSGGSNSGASGGINNSNNGSSGGTNPTSRNSGGSNSGGSSSGGINTGAAGSGTGSSTGGNRSGTTGSAASGGCGCSGGCSSGGANSSTASSNTSSDFMIDNAPGVADHSLSSSSVYSPAGVRYFDGQINVSSTDLSTDGFGSLWNQTRSWSNGSPPSSDNGTGIIDWDRPYLLEPNGNNSEIVVVSNATDARFFSLVGSTYVPQFYIQDQLTHNTSTGEFILTDTMGDQIHFFDWSGSQANQWGQFKSCTDAKGNLISVTSWTSNGNVAEMQRTDSSSGVTQSYLYTYLTSPDPNAGMISNITLRQNVDNGPWTIVRQVAYDYYDGTNNKPYGNLGDLRTATTLDGNNNVIDTTYYRYYTPADAGGIGYVHGLKYVFSPQSYARMAADISNPLTATDAQVAPYADDYYQYDPTSQRVTMAVIQGNGCSVCTGGQGTFTYSYASSTFSPGYNSWAEKTVETLPDSSTNTVYTNFAGETMLDVFQSGSQKWENFYQYDASGRLILQANPSAVTGYNDSYADLLDQNQVGDYGYLSSTTGLIQLTDYYSSTTATETTPGGAAGYYQDTKLEQGKAGTPILQSSAQYFAHTAGMTIYPVATSTVYRNTDGTGAETTSYAYTWYTGTTAMQTKTVSLPVISAAENGPGTADVWVYTYDPFGRVTQTVDPDGYVDTYQYDQATGAQTQSVIDSGAGHLNLTMSTQVDALGRPVKVTDPNGNVTYTVYNDANHEVRVYPGWTGTTTTGPTQVTRQDRTHDPSYTETFTMSATPHVTNGQPDGTEAYAFLQSLSRTITSRGGQVIEQDAYFNLGRVPYSTSTYLGTAGTNYYATQDTYDNPRGWLSRVLSPTGTIYRTVYDALGRVVSTWVGTNDTPASGSWSPSNNTAPSNMVQVTGNVWDGGNTGDSLLTQVTQYPGGTAAARVTQNFYDWRERLVASKQGVQTNENDGTHRPIFYSQYDNLSELITSQRYDGDGVTITSTGGVPNPPSASLLRAQTTTEYDDQGRVYQSNVYSVDQSQGTVSANSLTTNSWYNHRGLVIKSSPPGAPVTKTSYDGAGRPTVVYTTDAYLDSTWSDAGTVSTNNNVLSQTEITYDNDSNPILVTTRNRFDNETQGGPLGTPTTHPYARVSYVSYYFDAASRLTNTGNVGTNGGSSYTRPGTPPARSDTVLVTSTNYLADAVQQVALAGSPTGGTFTLSFGGKTTTALAYNATAATVQGALQNLSSIGANDVLVSGPAGGPWLVRFAGMLAGTPEIEMGSNGSGLTGGNSPSVSVGTTSQGGDTGRVQSVTDPRALISKTDYDLLGRTIRTIQNFVAFAPSNSADQTTQYTYDGSNHILTLSAVLPGSVLETTQYTYGVSSSIISSNDLLASTTYPANGKTNTESYSYNALGQKLMFTDRNGTVHSYSYDVLGRPTSDAVTTLGSTVDGTVQRIDTGYDTGGRPYLYTSYSTPAGTTIVNQVEDLYNGLGQLLTEYQSHSGAVNLSTTPKVQYAYSFVATSGGPNHSRLVSMTYPNGRVLNYNYNSGVDDRISRLSSLSDSSATLEVYSYLGLNTIVQRSHPQDGVNQTYIIPGGNTDGGDKYTGLDRFGRVVETRWVNVNTNTVTDDFLYTYDRDGNVISRTNALDTSLNEQYSYDGLNRLVSFTRGSYTESWSLDAVGNWLSVTIGGSTQTRTFNSQNQITAVSGASTPIYDADGNMLYDQSGTHYAYDAWNREVVQGSLRNSYDALGRCITSAPATEQNDLYYSSAWQLLEEDFHWTGGSQQTQYVWSATYLDALVERDTYVSGSREYVQEDANWNTTAAVSVTGTTVDERYLYDPYGTPTYCTAAWGTRSSSSLNWIYLFQGGRYDGYLNGTNGWVSIGAYSFRHRDQSPTLGLWLEQDPISYAGGINLYEYVSDRPDSLLDPMGTTGALALPLSAAAGGIGTTVGAVITAALLACAAPPAGYVKSQQGTIWNNDKWAHCVVSCRIARVCSNWISWAVGYTGEAIWTFADFRAIKPRDLPSFSGS